MISLLHDINKETLQSVSKQFQSFKVALLGQDRAAIVREKLLSVDQCNVHCMILCFIST